MTDRRRQLGAIHAAKRDLGLTDPEYRALLAGATGVSSAADLATDAQYGAVMAAFRSAGWRGPRRRRLTGQMATCYALWCRLHEAGAVRTRSYPSLMSWIARQVGVQDVYRQDQLRSCIEQLKLWHQRVQLKRKSQTS